MNSVLKRTAGFAVLCGVIAVPFTVSAHEVQVFEMKGVQYEIVVGSLNEPLVVDDKSGVDLRVATLPGKKPVEGLQDTLKVELIAGDKKKEMELAAVYNTPGSYKAPFYPTVATTLSYRVFGEIAGTPFDQTFTCLPGGHASVPEDTNRVSVSEGVVRVSKTGGFGCPEPKAAMGFPEASADLLSLVPEKSNNALGSIALALSAAAFALVVARRRS